MAQSKNTPPAFEMLIPNNNDIKIIMQRALEISNIQQSPHIDQSHLMCAMLENGSILEILDEVSISENNEKIDKMILEVNALLPVPLSPEPENIKYKEKELDIHTETIINSAYYKKCQPLRKPLSAGALLWAISCYPGKIKNIFKENDINSEEIHAYLWEMQEYEEGHTNDMMQPYSLGFPPTNESEKFTCDLVAMAKSGELPHVEVNPEVMDSLICGLLRQIKPNVVLVGGAGVGKTAVVEALAHKIARNDVPRSMLNRRLIELKVSSLIAGTSLRGQMEERLSKFIDSLNKNDIVFIDELHNIIGAGAVDDSPMDAAQILKPALARGQFSCIGATTSAEYRRYIQPDAALVRRFEEVHVPQPSATETRMIIERVLARAMPERNIRVLPEALDRVIELTAREMPTRNWPDKAIDVLDSALASIRIKNQRVLRPENIDSTVTRMTGAPTNRIPDGDLATRLMAKIHGQDDICKAIAQRINRAFIGLNAPTTPLGRFLFTGQTGTGKSELAKTLASELKMNITRLDMSEYRESHTISRLIGAPNGYKGADRGGLLTEAMRENKNRVVLFDEVEKAHPDVRMLLLQILNEGTLTDAQGNSCDFRSSIVILTANTGAQESMQSNFGFSTANHSIENARKAVENQFPPELLGRIDEVFVFNAPSQSVNIACAKHYIQQMSQNLQQRYGIEIHATTAEIEKLLAMEFDRQGNGRAIQQHVEKSVGDAVLTWMEEKMPKSGTLHLDIENNVVNLVYRRKPRIIPSAQKVVPKTSPRTATHNK